MDLFSVANNKCGIRGDTRNNWVRFMLVSKCRYEVFGKQKTINACTADFRELEPFGFRFGVIGFAGCHVHLSVDIPKRDSAEDAETMLKSHSSQRIFTEIPNFRKRYPRGSFWSVYEHHESAGIARRDAEQYIRDQPAHHGIDMAGIQKAVFEFAAAAE